MASPLAHRGARMSGRDPEEDHRTATPLELLFDVTFVIAYGSAAHRPAHALAAGRTASGVRAFAVATSAISWASISFAWFASYDTDD